MPKFEKKETLEGFEMERDLERHWDVSHWKQMPVITDVLCNSLVFDAADA